MYFEKLYINIILFWATPQISLVSKTEIPVDKVKSLKTLQLGILNHYSNKKVQTSTKRDTKNKSRQRIKASKNTESNKTGYFSCRPTLLKTIM